MPHILTYNNKVITQNNKAIVVNRYNNGVNFNKSNDYGQISWDAALVMPSTSTDWFLFSIVPLGLVSGVASTIFSHQMTTNLFFTVSINGNGLLVIAVFDNTVGLLKRIVPDNVVIRNGSPTNIIVHVNGNDPTNWKCYVNGELKTCAVVNTGATSWTDTSGQSFYLANYLFNPSENFNGVYYKSGRFTALTDPQAKFMTLNDGILPPNFNHANILYYHQFTAKSGTSVGGYIAGREITLVNCTTTLGASNQWVDKYQQPKLT